MIEQSGLIADIANLSEIFNRVSELYRVFHNNITDITQGMKDKKYTDSQLVDLGFLCREFETVLDEWRKDAKVRKELSGKLLAHAVMTRPESVNSPVEITVHGQLATGTPNLRMMANLPKKGTPEYDRVCQHFGILQDGLTKIDWKAMQERLNHIAETGEQMPDGIGEQIAMYSTTFRRK